MPIQFFDILGMQRELIQNAINEYLDCQPFGRGFPKGFSRNALVKQKPVK
jgi:hypothetical protein